MRDFLDALSQFEVLLIVGAMLCLLGLMAYFHMRKGNTYSALDILLDHNTKKASLDAHLTLFFSVIASWFIVLRTLQREDVGEELTELVMIFVIYRGAKQAIQAYRDKPTDPAVVQEGDTVEQQVNITPKAAPNPPPIPALKAKRK